MEKLILKDCGLHYGQKSGPCSKCNHFNQMKNNPKIKAGLQYQGTPFIACLETPWQAEERKMDESLARYRLGIY